ncbi:MAG: tetratricopeptide repeat protein [Verrucomicrobia bacterium]|nr:tetratricopeptide repeat protein [Verrucomicrobiota bacterium]
MSSIREFYNSPYWRMSLVGSYGINSEIEPRLEQIDIERLREVTPLIQSGEAAQQLQALNSLITFARTQPRPNPQILQLIGALSMAQLADATTDAERQRLREQARDYFTRAINPDTGFPNFLRAHKNLANLLFQMERADEAVRHFIRAIELGDRDAVTYGILGAIYFEQGRLVAAESAVRMALMTRPDIFEFKQLLANILFQQDRYQEAAAQAAEMLAIRPNDHNLWLLQGNAFIAMDRIDDAVNNLEVVRAMGRANTSALTLLGDVYINKNMTEDAAKAYIEAIAADTTTNPEPFLRPAQVLQSFGSYELSMQVLDKLEERFANHITDALLVTIQTIRSQNNIALGKGEEAARNLQAIIDADPLNGSALVSLARYYAELDFNDRGLSEDEQRRQESLAQQRAINLFQRAQSLDDSDVRVRALVGEAQLRVRRGEFTQAESLLTQAQNLRPQESVQAFLDQIRAANRARSARASR